MTPTTSTPQEGALVAFRLAPVPVALDPEGLEAAVDAQCRVYDEGDGSAEHIDVARAAVEGYLTHMLGKVVEDEPEFYSPATLARRWEASERKVRALLEGRHPALPSHKFGGLRRVHRADVAAYEAAHRSNGNGNGR